MLASDSPILVERPMHEVEDVYMLILNPLDTENTRIRIWRFWREVRFALEKEIGVRIWKVDL